MATRVHRVPAGTMPAAQPRLSTDFKGAALTTTQRVLPTGRKAKSSRSLFFVYETARRTGFHYPGARPEREPKWQAELSERCTPMRRDGVFTRAK